MSIRKTESRLPNNLRAADLGQAVVSADGALTLISFITSPLVINRENVYVLFVTDTGSLPSGLIDAAICYYWTFSENGVVTHTQTTNYGEISYRPQQFGVLKIRVQLLDAENNELKNVGLLQQIVQPNAELEAMIEKIKAGVGPGPGNPAVLRELVNDLCPYYQSVILPELDGGAAFREFTYSMVYDGVLQKTPLQRREHIRKVAQAINTNRLSELLKLTATGLGPCQIRLPLLAMTLSRLNNANGPYLSWTELPATPARYSVADLQLRRAYIKLPESTRIDLFNLLRFPKSNIVQCARLLETMRNRYFGKSEFRDVLSGMSGTRAHWIAEHFRRGPLQRVKKINQALNR